MIRGITTGPIIPTVAEIPSPIPLTTVGYNSEAKRGKTTNEEEIPNLPMQYRTKVTLDVVWDKKVATQAIPPIIMERHNVHLLPKRSMDGQRNRYVGSSARPANKKFK